MPDRNPEKTGFYIYASYVNFTKKLISDSPLKFKIFYYFIQHILLSFSIGSVYMLLEMVSIAWCCAVHPREVSLMWKNMGI